MHSGCSKSTIPFRAGLFQPGPVPWAVMMVLLMAVALGCAGSNGAGSGGAALDGVGSNEVRSGSETMLVGTLEWSTEGGLFLKSCEDGTAKQLHDPQGVLESTGGFASIYVARASMAAWSVEGINYLPGEGFGCTFPWSEVLWQADGNEPFWTTRLAEDGVTLRVAGASPRVIPVSRQDGPVFRGEGLELALVRERCVDTMADTHYGWTAVLKVDDITYRGCGFQGLAGI